MKSISKRFNYLVMFFVASLISMGNLLAIAPGQAFAQEGGDTPPTGSFYSMAVADQAVVWSSYKAATSTCNVNDLGLSEQDIKDGKWLREATIQIGHHVETDDGKLDCDNERNWFTNLLNKAGVGGDMLAAGKTVFDVGPDGKYYPKADAKRLLTNLIADKLFGGSAPGSTPEQVLYGIYMANFTVNVDSSCAAAPTNGAADAANFDRTEEIYVYNAATKKPELKEYGYKNPTNLITVGWVADPENAEMQCQRLAELLKKPQYANAVAGCVESKTCAGFTSNSGTTPGEDPSLQCGTDYNSLNWYICPFVKGINRTIGALDNAINSLLSVDQDEILNEDTKNGARYYVAWESFRNIALGLLVVAAIGMLIAQGLGFEFLDAYTVKKIFPRLVIAIIGIALSWELMYFFVGFTNDLGYGIRQIIYYPFQGLNSDLQLGGGATVALVILSSSGLLALGIIGLLSFVATAALAVAIAFLVLIVRQLVIIVLVLLAPIAIACYILPNTNGAWKLWYESFSKALLMFPIIVAFLAIGRVFAAVSMTSGAGEITAVSQMIGFAAYFMPYFLIPLTFRFAGGAMRTLGGFVNDKGRGGFDRLRKYRQGKTATNMHDFFEGNRLKGDSRAAKSFNAVGGTLGAIPKTNFGLRPRDIKQWGTRLQATQSRLAMNEVGEFTEKNVPFSAIKNNDDFLTAAVKHKGDEAGMYTYLREHGYDEVAASQGVAAIRAARREASDEVFDTAAVMALPATGTAFKQRYDEKTGKFIGGGAGEMHDFINEVAGEDRVRAGRMLAAMRSGASSARRFDLAGGGFSDQIQTLNQQYATRQEIDQGYITDAKAPGGKRMLRTTAEKKAALLDMQQSSSRHIVESSLEGQGGSYIAGGRKQAVENFAPVMFDKLVEKRDAIPAAIKKVEDARKASYASQADKSKAIEEAEKKATAAQREFDQEIAVVAGRYDAMAQVSPENARVLADRVLGKHILTTTEKVDGKEQRVDLSVQQLIERKRNDPQFVQLRREYGSAGLRGALSAEQAEKAAIDAKVRQPIGPQQQ